MNHILKLSLIFGVWASGMLYGSYIANPDGGNYWVNLAFLLSLAAIFTAALMINIHEKVDD